MSLLPGASSRQEKEAFNHFQSYMANKLPGVFESEFWEKLVLQASVQETAVLQSTIALAAGQLGNEALTLTAYNRAIGGLGEHLKRQDTYALRVTLITCILFTSLEFLRGSRSTGESHLHNGLRLLRELPSQAGNPSSGGSQKKIIRLSRSLRSVDDSVVEAFTRMNVQFAVFGQGSEFLYQLGHDARNHGSSSYHVPLSFDRLGEARQWLDLLINGVLSLSSQADKHVTGQLKFPSNMRRMHKRIEAALEKWMLAFESSLQTVNATGSTRISIGLDVLRTYHTMTKIMAATCLRGRDETVYDKHTASFASLLYQVWGLWNRAAVAFRDTPSKFSFTTDMGFIPPLYFTALKCREPNLRRMAVDLLAKAPHIEGPWDGRIAAAVARRVMKLEEGDTFHDHELTASIVGASEVKDEAVTPSLPIVPASSRANKVIVHSDPTVREKARVEVRIYVRERVNKQWKWTCEVKELNVDVTPQLTTELRRVSRLNMEECTVRARVQ
ncbi:hypothetical protein DL769_000850 [Monosporascus sp. CRB-8-3]|nr:hypothetical protein DL769_000850 [Monosporascus sp. CRB-8-3]